MLLVDRTQPLISFCFTQSFHFGAFVMTHDHLVFNSISLKRNQFSDNFTLVLASEALNRDIIIFETYDMLNIHNFLYKFVRKSLGRHPNHELFLGNA